MNKLDLMQYRTFIFDCDGVVLNSNKIKTEAFYQTTKAYGHKMAQALVDYHVKNGGISRYQKFKYFLTEILGEPVEEAALDSLLKNFADEVVRGLTGCEIADGLDELREKTKHANWLIVSGGDQAELREVFSKRKLSRLFNAGIFGSPDNKDVILKREINVKNIPMPGLFLGDSQYDYEASKRAGLDFVYLSDWSESTYKFSDVDFKFKNIIDVLLQNDGQTK